MKTIRATHALCAAASIVMIAGCANSTPSKLSGVTTAEQSTAATSAAYPAGTAHALVGNISYDFDLSKCTTTGDGPQAYGAAKDGTTLLVHGRNFQVDIQGRGMSFDGRFAPPVYVDHELKITGYERGGTRTVDLTLVCGGL